MIPPPIPQTPCWKHSHQIPHKRTKTKICSLHESSEMSHKNLNLDSKLLLIIKIMSVMAMAQIRETIVDISLTQ
jgi:hypothetical protein